VISVNDDDNYGDENKDNHLVMSSECIQKCIHVQYW